jgi:hypothetical protein
MTDGKVRNAPWRSLQAALPSLESRRSPRCGGSCSEDCCGQCILLPNLLAEIGLIISISRQAHDIDAGDLAGWVKAEQQAGLVAAWKDDFHDVECLLADFSALHNVGTDR